MYGLDSSIRRVARCARWALKVRSENKMRTRLAFVFGSPCGVSFLSRPRSWSCVAVPRPPLRRSLPLRLALVCCCSPRVGTVFLRRFGFFLPVVSTVTGETHPIGHHPYRALLQALVNERPGPLSPPKRSFDTNTKQIGTTRINTQHTTTQHTNTHTLTTPPTIVSRWYLIGQSCAGDLFLSNARREW